MMQYFLTTIALLALNACGTPGRPVGLPPPEYQEPKVEPWAPPPAATAPSSSIAEPQPPLEPPPAATPENVGGSGATLPPGNL
jgi:hypothetical protein